MGFSMRGFLMRGFKDAVGKMTPYQIIQDAAKWMNKGVLQESDLEEICNALISAGQVSAEDVTPMLGPVPTEVSLSQSAAAGLSE